MINFRYLFLTLICFYLSTATCSWSNELSLNDFSTCGNSEASPELNCRIEWALKAFSKITSGKWKEIYVVGSLNDLGISKRFLKFELDRGGNPVWKVFADSDFTVDTGQNHAPMLDALLSEINAITDCIKGRKALDYINSNMINFTQNLDLITYKIATAKPSDWCKSPAIAPKLFDKLLLTFTFDATNYDLMYVELSMSPAGATSIVEKYSLVFQGDISPQGKFHRSVEIRLDLETHTFLTGSNSLSVHAEYFP